MKKLIAFLIAVFMLAGTILLTACSDGKDPVQTPDNTPGNSSEPSGTPTSSSSTPSSDNTEPSGTPASSSDDPISTTAGDVPGIDNNDGYSKLNGYLDVDFGGRTFTFVPTNIWNPDLEYFQTDSRDSGTIINAAAYDRNQIMKKLYNCQIVGVEGNSGTLISNDVNSGTNQYDFGAAQGQPFATNTNGYYFNIYDLDLDFNIPGYNIPYINQVTSVDKNGTKKLYNFDATFNAQSMGATWALYVNVDLWNQNMKESIFDLVNNYEWTIDKMMEAITVVAQDNGDQTWKAGEDVFGLMTTTHNAYGLITSFGLRLADIDDNGRLYSSPELILANNAVEAINKGGELYAMEQVYVGSYTLNQQSIPAGKTLFMGEVLAYIVEANFYESEAVLSPIPQPLYSSEQKSYKSHVNGTLATWAISKNACGGDKQMISDFINLFVFHSDKIFYPAVLTYYGQICCQDEHSVEMIEHILSNRQYDYSYYRTGLFAQVADFMHHNKNSIARAANKLSSSLDESISGFLDNLTKSE